MGSISFEANEETRPVRAINYCSLLSGTCDIHVTCSKNVCVKPVPNYKHRSIGIYEYFEERSWTTRCVLREALNNTLTE
jgi:hypothetical protein